MIANLKYLYDNLVSIDFANGPDTKCMVEVDVPYFTEHI